MRCFANYRSDVSQLSKIHSVIARFLDLLRHFPLVQFPLPWASAHRGRWGQLTPLEKWIKIKKQKHAKKSSCLCLCYILRAIRAGRCRERRYANHIFIQIYFRMHHFQNLLRLRRQGGIGPPNQNPADVPAHCSFRKFRKLLKSHCFSQDFNIC